MTEPIQHSTDSRTDRSTYRSGAAVFGVRAGCYVAAILVLGEALSSPSASLVVLSVIALVGLVAFCELRAARVQLIATPDTITVRNALSSLVVARDDVTRLSVEPWTSRWIQWTSTAVVLHLNDGRKVPVSALPISVIAGRASRKAVADLNAMLITTRG